MLAQTHSSMQTYDVWDIHMTSFSKKRIENVYQKKIKIIINPLRTTTDFFDLLGSSLP